MKRRMNGKQVRAHRKHGTQRERRASKLGGRGKVRGNRGRRCDPSGTAFSSLRARCQRGSQLLLPGAGVRAVMVPDGSWEGTRGPMSTDTIVNKTLL